MKSSNRLPLLLTRVTPDYVTQFSLGQSLSPRTTKGVGLSLPNPFLESSRNEWREYVYKRHDAYNMIHVSYYLDPVSCFPCPPCTQHRGREDFNFYCSTPTRQRMSFMTILLIIYSFKHSPDISFSLRRRYSEWRGAVADRCC